MRRGEAGFTFVEVMVTVVILSVGITGIYRALLLSLDQQQYLLTRLYIMNFLTDESAKAESLWITKKGFPSGDTGRIDFDLDKNAELYAQRAVSPWGRWGGGLERIDVQILWKKRGKEQHFKRSTLVYVKH